MIGLMAFESFLIVDLVRNLRMRQRAEQALKEEAQ
jgi:hypothetical protein